MTSFDSPSSATRRAGVGSAAALGSFLVSRQGTVGSNEGFYASGVLTGLTYARVARAVAVKLLGAADRCGSTHRDKGADRHNHQARYGENDADVQTREHPRHGLVRGAPRFLEIRQPSRGKVRQETERMIGKQQAGGKRSPDTHLQVIDELPTDEGEAVQHRRKAGEHQHYSEQASDPCSK
jgi:hypothetical protein